MLELTLEHPLISFFILYCLICYLVTHKLQRTKAEFIYKPNSNMAAIVEKYSNLKSSIYEYVPYMFAFHMHMQGLIFTAYTLIHEEIF